MKLLCFQAKRFRWKTHSKTLPEVVDQEIEREVEKAVIVFVHAEEYDAGHNRYASVLRQSVKHVKWLANKRGLKHIVLHSFTHLGGDTARPVFAHSFIETAAARLRETGYEGCTTPF